MMMWKQLFRTMLFACAAAFLLAAQAMAAEIVQSGYCGGEGDGTNITWTLDSEGTLRFNGRGAMRNYKNYVEDSPFYEESVRINTKIIVVEEGVTSITNSPFFMYFAYLSDISVNPNNKSYTTQNGVLFDKDITRLLTYPRRKSASSFSIPSGVKIIKSNAFFDSRQLEHITLPDGLEKIETYAFQECDSLKSVTIPTSVITIERCVFRGCDSFKDIYYKGTQEQWNAIIIDYSNDGETDVPNPLETATIHFNSNEPSPLNFS